LITRLTGPDFSKMSVDELFAALDNALNVDASMKALDDLVGLAEHSVRVGKPVMVGDVLYGVVQRDTRVADPESKRAYVLAIRRLAKPALLRAVATLIPKKPERKQHFFEVLGRTGEEGADALIEQITQAQTNEDRRTLFEVLVELPAAVPALIRMLGDSRWFVARNAADLLGEMVATQAEEALIALLRHSDDRVRRSATNALLKLGTPNAFKGIYDAVSDTSPEVRMQAAVAIATRKDGRTSATLIRAIEDEADVEVQMAMIAALGRVATPDAVQKLVKMAEPEGRLFRKKAINIRVAAVQALGDAKTVAAVAALKALVEDKERDVRETATRALAHAGR
ncbi:MAG: HEAT repeat domain-containing protein, partial [Gemmatimonadaceae bacterium]